MILKSLHDSMPERLMYQKQAVRVETARLPLSLFI